MCKAKVVFVILHYQNINVTVESVCFLKRLHGISNHHIIIVDNASPNNSGIKLKDKYDNNPLISCILAEQNGGFAYGNNLGYKFAKEKLKADIIVAMNSDVYVEDRNFVRKLIDCSYSNRDISIIAPDIEIRNGCHQNPFLLEPISTINQMRIIFKKYIGYALYSLPKLGTILINRKTNTEYPTHYNVKIDTSIKGIVPHGSCVIYLESWINAEENAFVEGTFLFVEEELLYDYCQEKGHIISYEPHLIVRHMEDASQNAIHASKVDKKCMQIRCEIQSRKILLKNRKKKFITR